MKDLFSIFLALLIAIQPLSRVVIVAHYQAQKAYIAKNVCEKKDIKLNTCEGRCYLKKQLSKATEAEKKANTSLKTLLEKQVQPHSYCFSFQYAFTVESAVQNGHYPEPFTRAFIKDVFRPPVA